MALGIEGETLPMGLQAGRARLSSPCPVRWPSVHGGLPVGVQRASQLSSHAELACFSGLRNKDQNSLGGRFGGTEGL
jgi:hypothetical protein